MDSEKRTKPTRIGAIRQSDIEPYTALKWVSQLFKGAAVFLAVAVIGEFIAGVRFDGFSAVPVLMGELARTIVLAVVLWGGGDLVRLLIHLGHDIRAERILIARLVNRLGAGVPVDDHDHTAEILKQHVAEQQQERKAS